MRPIYIAGNWKMNKSLVESNAFFEELVSFNKSFNSKRIVQIVCPSYIYLEKTKEITRGSNICIGAQNCSEQDNGAFTGEISVEMLKGLNIEYCIVGHSERRQFYAETDNLIQQKYLKLKAQGIIAIICIGETLTEREANKTFSVIESQLEGIFKGFDSLDNNTFLIAYEPVWAIGTGKTASPEQAQEVHQFIRNWFEKKYNKEIANGIAILYGGSVKPSNIKELLSCPDIDGGLIGGASLDLKSYTEMVSIAEGV
ncbi:MAG TPA: triose-phosphate isomerase [Candidatus Cloacimonadota bacterium]|nr:triose-phosphate isomerase [Candidatus Cloacimonadota bacterium]HQB41801.1 triose-phosphate isomerase [Candidatus Cloacimonadota bacterium]